MQAFGHAASPPLVVNVTGPETLSVRRVAEQMGELLQRPVRFVGSEAPDALLSNAGLAYRLFGRPQVSTIANDSLDCRLVPPRRGHTEQSHPF